MAETNIEKLLNAEIEKTLRELSQAKTGSDEARAALIKLDKLHGERAKELEAFTKAQQLIDSTSTKKEELRLREVELELKERQLTDDFLAKQDEMKIREAELELRNKQLAQELNLKTSELEKTDAELKEAKKARRWKTAIDILGIGVPLGVSGWFMYQGMKFEEEGKVFTIRTPQWISGITRLFKKG